MYQPNADGEKRKIIEISRQTPYTQPTQRNWFTPQRLSPRLTTDVDRDETERILKVLQILAYLGQLMQIHLIRSTVVNAVHQCNNVIQSKQQQNNIEN